MVPLRPALRSTAWRALGRDGGSFLPCGRERNRRSPSGPFSWVSALLPPVLLIYLAIAMRVVYRQNWIVSVLKAVLGFLVFLLMLVAWLASTSWVASLLA